MNESVTAELERYKERVKIFEQRLNIDLSSREKMIDSQMDDMIKEKLALKEQVDSLEQNLSKQIKEKECLLQTFMVFKNESKEKEDKYMENEIDLEKKIKELDNILFKVGQSAQIVHMLTKPQAFYDNIHKQALGYQNLFHLKKAQRIKPTLYDGIVMSDKHVAMSVIDDEEILILEEESRSKMSEKAKDPEVINKNISHKPIDYEKLNRLTEDFGKHFTLQQELSAEQAFWLRMSDPTSKLSDALPVKIEAPKELPKISLVNESLKKLKFHLAKFDNVVKIRTTPNARTEEFFKNNDLKAQLQDKDSIICKLKDIIKSLKEKSKEENVKYDYCDIETKNVEMFLKSSLTQLKKACVRSKEQSDSLIDKLNLKSTENEDLKAQIQDKVIANRDVHIKYLKYAQEQADILQGIVKQAKAKQPLDKELDFACKHAQRIQELLVYVQDTFPNTINNSAKKVAVTPKNKVKKVRFVKPLTSSSNSKHVESSKTSDSNTHVLSSTLKCSTSKCGSKPTRNKRNDKISQTTSRNMKNKVEAQPRKVNKNNRVIESICDGDVKHSLLNANSEPICANCKKSMFDDVHDNCLLDFVKNVVQIVLWYLDSGCLKHMTGYRSQLMNFVSKFLGIVRFGNDNIARIMGYGDYQDKKPDLSFFHVFGALCYPTNDNDDLGKLDAKADIEADAPRAVVLADSPVSTSIDQDAPSSTTPSTQEQE
ncbi:hypothetical protein Tco_1094514 [Tanacetum coccineum]|uniref:Retrovirus-related Pol polyprotein from transposon TNT 1-94-like beta-barrel domain-containing protein n=1 Tax=Tanacetum coccineum TaxID=301880 RepID=A0ABQ5IHR5_9ASTR